MICPICLTIGGVKKEGNKLVCVRCGAEAELKFEKKQDIGMPEELITLFKGLKENMDELQKEKDKEK